MSHVGSTKVLGGYRGFYSIVLKRVKEVGNIIDARSQDLRLVISQLRGTVKNTQSTHIRDV